MDRFDSMSILLAAVDGGSLSAAARRLNVPLTTVSRRISELERRLNTKLLQRSPRRLSLTDAGQSYVAACRRILEDLDEAERVATGEYSSLRGTLNITAPVVFGRLHVLPIVIEFLGAHPEISIRMIQADRTLNLWEEHIDLAIRIGELPDSSLIATKVGSVRRVVCASPAYFARRGTPQSPADLAVHDCITFEGIGSGKAWGFGAGKTEARVAIPSKLSVNTAEAAIDAAMAGLGITRVLSYQVTEQLRNNRLVLALEAEAPFPVPVSFVYDGQGFLPQKLRAFIDFAVPRLKASLLAVSI
jgi:DNA-binding transcriptional LysR family regulator